MSLTVILHLGALIRIVQQLINKQWRLTVQNEWKITTKANELASGCNCEQGRACSGLVSAARNTPGATAVFSCVLGVFTWMLIVASYLLSESSGDTFLVFLVFSASLNI